MAKCPDCGVRVGILPGHCAECNAKRLGTTLEAERKELAAREARAARVAESQEPYAPPMRPEGAEVTADDELMAHLTKCCRQLNKDANARDASFRWFLFWLPLAWGIVYGMIYVTLRVMFRF